MNADSASAPFPSVSHQVVVCMTLETFDRISRLLARDARNRESVRKAYHAKGLAKGTQPPQARILDTGSPLKVIGMIDPSNGMIMASAATSAQACYA